MARSNKAIRTKRVQYKQYINTIFGIYTKQNQ